MRGSWMTGLPGLLVLALVGSGLLPSQAAAADQGAAGASRHAAAARDGGSGLEDRVSTLTKALDLDAKQEAALRKVLQRQRDEVQRIWSDDSVPSANRIFLTKAVSKHTGDEIRALLNEEQRKKYDPPPQGDAGTVSGSARVEDWMKGGTSR
jgi:hypothetical protein